MHGLHKKMDFKNYKVHVVFIEKGNFPFINWLPKQLELPIIITKPQSGGFKSVVIQSKIFNQVTYVLWCQSSKDCNCNILTSTSYIEINHTCIVCMDACMYKMCYF